MPAIEYDDPASVRSAAELYQDNSIVLRQIIDNLLEDKRRLLAVIVNAREQLEPQASTPNPSLLVVRQVVMALGRAAQ